MEERIFEGAALDEERISDKAVNKLEAERKAATEKDKLMAAATDAFKVMKLNTSNKNMLDSYCVMRCTMIEDVVRMLTRFCYQNEDFADEVLKCERDVGCAVDAILGKISADRPALSDLEAYAAAVQFYIPSAQVTVSFRLNIPCELDDDLIGLGDDEGSQTMILDLFEAEE